MFVNESLYVVEDGYILFFVISMVSVICIIFEIVCVICF